MSHFGTKVTPWGFQTVTTSPSDSVARDTENYAPTVEPVKDFMLMTDETELKNSIKNGSEFHTRPMSDSEYNSLITMLKKQTDSQGRQLFKYQLAALARVIKENFVKYFPDMALDYEVGNSMEFHFEVDNIFKDAYEDSLDRFRQPFTTYKAEEVMDSYSSEEKRRLRSLGVAFTAPSFEILEEMDTSRAFVESAQKLYQHPLLKYNLLKGKK